MEYVVDKKNDTKGEAEKVYPLSDNLTHGFKLFLEVSPLFLDF